ncbi:MAG: twin-arginine translocation signal domain-containing protein, partial [Pirellulaceae bacterium]|nr:twin-arginine translocation signal domain-containing protein [Pirellulaceae bacterium]
MTKNPTVAKPKPALARRNFLKSATGLAVSLGTAPYFVPRSAFGANERINTGHIGTGGRG